MIDETEGRVGRRADAGAPRGGAGPVRGSRGVGASTKPRSRWAGVATVATVVLATACGGGERPSGDAGNEGDAVPAAARSSGSSAGGRAAPGPLADPSWTVQYRDSAALFVGLHALDTEVVWVAGHGGRVGRTVDGGASWRVGVVPGGEDLGFRDVHAFSVDEAVVLSIGSGEESRIYRTSDGGEGWREVFRNHDPDAFFDCLAFWDDRRGFAFSDAVDGEFVLIRTDDGGESWTRIDPARVPDARPGEGSFAASGTCTVAEPGGRGWFATGASGVDTRVVRTDDYGESWEEARTPVPSDASDEGLTSLAFWDGSHGAAFGGLALDSAVNVVVTEDGGATWTEAARGVLGGTVYGSSVVPGTPSPTVVAVSPEGSAWSDDGGRSWTRFDTLEHWTVDFVHAGAGWAAGRGIISRIGSP